MSVFRSSNIVIVESDGGEETVEVGLEIGSPSYYPLFMGSCLRRRCINFGRINLVTNWAIVCGGGIPIVRHCCCCCWSIPRIHGMKHGQLFLTAFFQKHFFGNRSYRRGYGLLMLLMMLLWVVQVMSWMGLQCRHAGRFNGGSRSSGVGMTSQRGPVMQAPIGLAGESQCQRYGFGIDQWQCGWMWCHHPLLLLLLLLLLLWW